MNDAGIQIVGISYDPVAVLKSFSDEAGLTYSLLSDEGSKTIDAYGIRNTGARSARQQGIPHPGTFLVDQSGTITAKLFETVRTRHTTDALIKAKGG